MELLNLINISLSQRDKKILVIVFFIFLLLILLIGLIRKLLIKKFRKEGAKIDSHVAGYIHYGFVTDSRGFRKLAYEKNRILLFRQSLLPVLLLVICFMSLIVFCAVSGEDWRYIFDVYGDMIVKLEAPTTEVFGLTVWSEFPHIVEGSIAFHSDAAGFVAYLFLVLFLIAVWLYLSAVFKKMARGKRIREKSEAIYKPNLDLTVAPDQRPFEN